MVYNHFFFPMHTTKTIPPDTNDLPTHAEPDSNSKTPPNDSDKTEVEEI
jgi:hypothetical protein